MASRNKNKSQHESTMYKILRNASKNQLIQEDRNFAEKQLKKIYSQEFSKIMNEKKFTLLVDRNVQEIQQLNQSRLSQKAETFNRLQEKSLERREKILKDRLKAYQSNDKQWALKTQSIKHKVRLQQKEMLKTAEEYRIRSQTQWKQRQTQHTKKMKQFSQKYHYLTNNRTNTYRMYTQSNQLFNRAKYQELLKRRKKQFNSARKGNTIDQSIRNHQEKEYELTESKSKQQLQKLMSKMEKMEKISLKREETAKTQSIERAKRKLHQKVYKNSKPEIGFPCEKHEHKMSESKFRVKTVENPQAPSRLRASQLQQSNLRLSMSIEQSLKQRNERNWEEYCRRSRRIQISRLLKASVRNTLLKQFKTPQYASKHSNF